MMHSDGSVLLYFVKLEFVKHFDIANMPFCENFGLCCSNSSKFLLEAAILLFRSILT